MESVAHSQGWTEDPERVSIALELMKPSRNPKCGQAPGATSAVCPGSLPSADPTDSASRLNSGRSASFGGCSVDSRGYRQLLTGSFHSSSATPPGYRSS